MKHSLRRLFKTPAFALTAIITVGAAIGANALIFSVVNGVILKPLPYANPTSLVGAWLVAPGVMAGPLTQSAATYFMLRENAQSFVDMGLWNNGSATITGRGEPEQIETLDVTEGTLPILGISPALGRGFSKEDDLPKGPRVVLISHRYWQRAFGGSPAAIGQSLMYNGAPREVIGVLPEHFRFLRANPDVIVPMKLDRTTIHAAGFNYRALARLKPGVTLEQANADVERLLPSLTQRFPLPPGFTQKMFDDARFGAARAAARLSTWWATSAACCGSCSAPWAWCCWSRARTSQTSSWCARRRASRSSRFAWRSAPKRGASPGS